jgi:Xaa-Pro aminopeptidase
MRFLVLGAGENSVFAHHIPTGRKLAVGDTIRLDVGAYFHGYASDIARMAFVGSPSPEQQSLYQHMVEIHQETIAAVRPGQQACDVYTACQRAFRARGLELTTPHVGHGFGVDGGHEEPLLHPANEALLEPGMVLAVEPIYHHPTLGGYHLEDLLLVTADGAQLLSDQTETTAPAIIPAEPLRV